MPKRPVLQNPNDTLRTVSEPVSADSFATDEMQTLIDDMIATMKAERGIGIAAPQVGINKRVIIVDFDNKPTAFFNPKLFAPSADLIESEEGCLSIPGVFGMVERHKKIKVKAYDRMGNPVRLSLSGIDAIVFQHEVDHLDGVLFIDRVTRYTNPPEGSVMI